eukprot:TRINITY_DN11740_c0_g1_i3.p1 TRINITY_DN11740_c0_g1~~TRINITY_DN11740_c0_g1_i3.p1  ORF type:complete len:786 (-),score=144.22 TRINITY_DN11740_c0_g1_i3:270-2558(-)
MGCGASSEKYKHDKKDSVADANEFLKKVKLFKRLPADDRLQLGKICVAVTFAPGKVIIKQGDENGSEFFVIKSGQAQVDVNGNIVATLNPGEYFGENALLRNEPRTATITAQTTCVCYKISRADFESMGLKEKLDFPKRGAVGGGVAADAVVQPPSPKTAEEIALMSKALQENTNLATMVTLDEVKTKAMVDLMWKEEVPNGTAIIAEGDTKADYFYIIQEGEFSVLKTEGGADTKAAHVGTLKAGTSFGELALLYFAPRAATIKATTNSVVWVIARQQFKQVMVNSAAEIWSEHIKYLDKVEILAPLKPREKKKLAEVLKDMLFVKDQTIFEQGEDGYLFYILVDGKVAVIVDGKQVATLEASRDEPQFFGEKALLTKEPRAATIQVLSDTAKTLTVNKRSFEMLLGPLKELQDRGVDGNKEVATVSGGGVGDRQFGLIKLADLKKLGLLGCGGFGAVELVEHKTTGDTYALKATSKGFILACGMEASIMSEKDVQLSCDSCFIVKLYETFNSQNFLYFLLELALGGEIYATYNKKNLWGNVACARFYIAGVVFAFDHMHGKNIVFRDLKPENLLLNTTGHVKLTDMGLAKVVIGKTFTTCGTPDYFAPELIKSKGHNDALDWWTLGILLFELLSGHPPFESEQPMQIYQKVTRGILKVQFPKACKGTVETLIKGLCAANPNERLPMGKGGSTLIKTHQWYKEISFNWEDMQSTNMTPPYIPSVKSSKDRGNFSCSKDDMPTQMPYKDPRNGWDKNFATST